MTTMLLVEDSEAQRAEVRAALAATGTFDRVLEAEDGIRGLKLLMSEAVDVVICDLEIPGLDGEKLLRVKATNPALGNTPFIFLTSCSDVARRARLLDAGASDALEKPFHPAELVARVALHLKVKRLQDELMVKNATLARLSTVDALTGLRTRRYVKELLSIEFLRARRYATPLSVVMADLDHFKEVNDGFGHPAGDAVLCGVVDRLTCTLRATDTAGRWGGEEILVVLPQNDAGGASVMAERWRVTVADEPFTGPSGEIIPVTVSLGIASFHPERETPDDLVAAADRALYRAKKNGRNRVEVADG